MQYGFDDQEAVDYGVFEAILIWNLRFWILKNKANNRHLYPGEDGIMRTWTYNSTEAFCKLFRFWSSDQIDRLIKKMITKEIIITGNFNQNSYNRTRWFAFQNEEKMLSPSLVISHFADSRNGNRDSTESNSRNHEKDSAKAKNGNGESAESNTDNLPFINPDKKPKGAEISWKEVLKGGGLSNEKKVWSVAEVHSFLSSETVARIKHVNLDIDVLLGRYVTWINTPGIGRPKNFDNAFPRWVEDFYKVELPKLAAKGLKNLSFDKWEDQAKVREQIKTLMHFFPSEDAQVFAVAPLSKTNTGWKISLSERNFEKLFQHQELLDSINVRIEKV